MNTPHQQSCSNAGWLARFTCPGCYLDLDYSEWNGKTGDCPECETKIHCYIDHEPVSVCELVEESDGA